MCRARGIVRACHAYGRLVPARFSTMADSHERAGVLDRSVPMDARNRFERDIGIVTTVKTPPRMYLDAYHFARVWRSRRPRPAFTTSCIVEGEVTVDKLTGGAMQCGLLNR